MLAKNHHECIDRVVAELESWQKGQRPRSWNVVAPPGFAASRLADGLQKTLVERFPGSKIAVVSADGVMCAEDFYVQVGHDWGVAHLSGEGKRSTPKIKIGDLLADSRGVLHILIIREFHKIIAALDEPILSALRDEEQAGAICTVAFSMYPHDWIKREWKARGGYFGASNYGDTHALFRMLPHDAPPGDIEGVPLATIAAIADQTGMYPEAFDFVLNDWRDRGSQALTIAERNKMADAAQLALTPLCRKIDYDHSRRYTGILQRMQMQLATDDDHTSLMHAHPWAAILVADGILRARALGGTLAVLELRDAIDSGRLPEEKTVVLNRVERNYAVGNYEAAGEIAKQAFAAMPSKALDLVMRHSEIMGALVGDSNDPDVPSLESNWHAVIMAVKSARKLLGAFAQDDLTVAELRRRYEELEQFGLRVLRARNDVRNGRLVDALGGLNGSPQSDRALAFQLVTLQLESSRALRRNVASVKSIVELPEQMMRLWGHWKHDLDYYRAPQLRREAADSAALEMGMHPEDVHWPGVGGRFFSMKSFCHYGFALEATFACSPTWCSREEFLGEVAFLESRNNMSHATVFIGAEDRKKFFEICDKWHSRIGELCSREIGATKEDTLRMFSPLPIPRLV